MECSPQRGYYYHPSRHGPKMKRSRGRGPGPSHLQSITARPPVTDPCACAGVGQDAPEGFRTTKVGGAAAGPFLTWSARSCWWRSSACPACCGYGGTGPKGTALDLDLLWRAYVRRFDLEHTFRFFKEALGWTTPRVRHPEQADRWTWLVVAAFTQLRLARACVEDLRLAWERRYHTGRLTPVRVHRVVSALLAHVGTPAKAPKPCGRSPGRPRGRFSGKAKRYPALKKSA